MSIITDKYNKALKMRIMCEEFDSADELVRTSASRPITDIAFRDMSKNSGDADWTGVKNLNEALELLKTGYQPTVDAIKGGTKANLAGQGKRITFENSVCGFSPIVPLAIMGVPNSMVNAKIKPIKNKVLDVYYDMTASCMTSSKQIIEAGQKLLGAIMELEMQGYRINLYAIQSYCNNCSADILKIKIKSASTPLDLKRISFPLTHTAFFRVIGFDWYSKTPKGKYRSAYGKALGYIHSNEEIAKGFKEMFNKASVVFTCTGILNKDTEYIKSTMKGGDDKNDKQ